MHPDIRRRLLTTVGFTAVALALTAAAALPAAANPGNGNGTSTANAAASGASAGNGNSSTGHVAPGQAKKTSSPTTSAGAAAAAPGQTKKSSSPTNNGKANGKGTSHAGGNGKGKAVGKGNGNGGGNGNGNGNGNGGGNGNAGGNGNGGGSGHNPPGNNGTVKIHQVAGDTSHHNVPHVSCTFYVDFWGFDQGQTLDVSFAGQAPTGKGIAVTFPAPDGTSITSPDPAGGGNDFDGELAFQATSAALAVLGSPQPQQGYHIKLTVTTHQPGGHKYKVFWVQPCSSTSPSTPPPTNGPGPGSGGSTSTGGGSNSSGGGSNSTGAHVLGLHISRTLPRAVNAASGQQSLPFTGGAAVLGMLNLGLAAMGVGLLMTMAGRRRQQILALS